MPKTVIVPLDQSQRSERALSPASALANRFGATLVVMTHGPVERVDDADRYLAHASRHAKDATVVRRATFAGDVADAIRTLVDEYPDPVIVMTSHGRSGFVQALLGSVAAAIVREFDTPVLLIGPAARPDEMPAFETVIVCTDSSETVADLVEVAAEWMNELGAPGRVVQVLDPDAPSLVRSTAGDLTEIAAVHAAADLLESRTDQGVEWEVLHSHDPAAALADYAARLPGVVLVMAAHGRSTVDRWPIGSTVAETLHRALAPVLVVRSGHDR